MRLWDPLAVRELAALLRDPVYRGRGVPRGDGRPVLLIPGFLAGDWTLRVMHSWLRRKVTEIRKETGSRVSLVGHSRGGLLAKVYAQRRPETVEQVIALGA